MTARGKGLSPATLNLDVKIIGGALNVARRQGLIPTNPAEAVELPEVERHGTRDVHPGGSEDAGGHGGRRMEAVNSARLLHRRRGFAIAAGCNGTAWTWPEER